MPTKLLQVHYRQKPVGYLGHENGIFRFHYLNALDMVDAISPLMPTTRMFYESKTLFPVFSQFIRSDEHLYPLGALEKLGHYGFGHLSFVNPSNPKLLPRRTLDIKTLQGAHSWEDINQLLGSKTILTIRFSQSLYDVTPIHMQSGVRFPTHLLYRIASDNDIEAICSTAQTISGLTEGSIRLPEMTPLPNIQAVLVSRCDLSSNGMRLPAHNLASLAGLTTDKALQTKQTLGRNQRLQLATRILRVNGYSPKASERITFALQQCQYIDPLLSLWLVDGSLFVIP